MQSDVAPPGNIVFFSSMVLIVDKIVADVSNAVMLGECPLQQLLRRLGCGWLWCRLKKLHSWNEVLGLKALETTLLGTPFFCSCVLVKAYCYLKVEPLSRWTKKLPGSTWHLVYRTTRLQVITGIYHEVPVFIFFFGTHGHSDQLLFRLRSLLSVV